MVLERACRGLFWARRTADYVDMLVPPHYSAAPSGDLCTTLRQAFVVRGESRTSVRTTGHSLQRSQSGIELLARGAGRRRARLAAVSNVPVSKGRVSKGSVALDVARGGSGQPAFQRSAHQLSRQMSGSATLERGVLALEQLKHSACNAGGCRIFHAIPKLHAISRLHRVSQVAGRSAGRQHINARPSTATVPQIAVPRRDALFSDGAPPEGPPPEGSPHRGAARRSASRSIEE